MKKLIVPIPELQTDFAKTLFTVRGLYLQDALRKTIETIDVINIDKELHKFAPRRILSELASIGLRGELVFATPCLLEKSPKLLGYYRLLLGFSQKAFYVSQYGLSIFKSMEEKGVLSSKASGFLEELCVNMNRSAANLLDGIGVKRVSANLLHDLTLLSLGAQLRGGANNQFGVVAIIDVFDIIRDIVRHSIVRSDNNSMEIQNAARRKVMIEFAPDPDIIIREEMTSTSFRYVIAIEVKGGKDFSNIHNRIGEAEKSHQKARRSGFVECWTVVNVEKMNMEMAKHESPSTDRFYTLSNLKEKTSPEYVDFSNRIVSLVGVAVKGKKTK
ncbi:MAG: XcyI family restriction endonuclease [Desulfobacteraceae bacterium]|nr:MAG: XcyI family restriction endonuclease [Desulfobacteraceae bacterium]